jgi:hypothetical protein
VAKQRCPMCGAKRMAGVLDMCRLAKDGVTEERLLERCDTCARFETDADAAVHYVTRFGGRLRYDQRAVVWTPDPAPGEERCTCPEGNLVDATCPVHGPALRMALSDIGKKEVAS